MIITDLKELRLPNTNASLQEALEIINKLEKELVYNTSGIGLAAPQIGIHKRVAIIRTIEHSINLINPIIIDKQRPIIMRGEGCLSIPSVFKDTWRFDEVFVKCDNNPAGIVGTGMDAIVLLHEIDHLDGILMIDKTINKQIGRNDLCPCGNKIKFKKCHGK